MVRSDTDLCVDMVRSDAHIYGDMVQLDTDLCSNRVGSRILPMLSK